MKIVNQYLLNRFFISLLAILLLGSCSFVRKTPKTSFTDGYYKQKAGGKKRFVYIDNEEDLLRIHSARKIDKQFYIDTTAHVELFPKEQVYTNSMNTFFSKNSMDVDFLIMPLKYRPAQKGVPSQLNGTLNGSVYLGYRTDKYEVTYLSSPIGKHERIINHYGFSFGVFGGLGNTAVTPTTTKNNLAIEYDGVVFSKGIAGIIAFNNFTAGVSLGFDNLLDTNDAYWIYQKKLWLGLTLGLNLN